MTYPIDAGEAALLESGVTSLAVCWHVVKRDASEIFGTTHDRDITIATGPYAGTYPSAASVTGSGVRSTDDLAVDNLEINGALSTGDLVLDVSKDDIKAGLFDNADVVTFLANWQTNKVVRVLRSGWIGNVRWDEDGRYAGEIRGLTQALSQTIVRTAGASCDAELGDARCKVVMTSHTFTGSVTAIVTQRRTFTATYDSPGPVNPGDLIFGRLTWTTGANNGYTKEVREDDPNVRLFDVLPNDIQVGDQFSVTEGCPKTREACRDRFANIENMRAPGLFVPGQTALLKVGKK